MEQPAVTTTARHGHSGGKRIIRAAYPAWPGTYPAWRAPGMREASPGGRAGWPRV